MLAVGRPSYSTAQPAFGFCRSTRTSACKYYTIWPHPLPQGQDRGFYGLDIIGDELYPQQINATAV